MMLRQRGGVAVMVVVYLMTIVLIFSSSNCLISRTEASAEDGAVNEDCDYSSSAAVASDDSNTQSQTVDSRCGNNRNGQQTLTRQQHEDRIRRRETWLFILQQRILQIRHGRTNNIEAANASTSVSRDDVNRFETMMRDQQQQQQQPRNAEISDQHTRKYRAFLSNCSGPPNFSRWNDANIFRLFFNIESADHDNRFREIKVLSAFLRLKLKQPTSGVADVNSNTNGVHETGDGGGAGRGRELEGGREGGEGEGEGGGRTSDGGRLSLPESLGKRELKVIIQAYSRPITRRVRHELKTMANKTVLIVGQSSGWLRINLKALAEEWLKRPQRNLGIQINVFDNENNSELNPGNVFEGVNCNEVQNQFFLLQLPLSSVEESFGSSMNDTIVDMDVNITHPYFDMVTAEVPRSRSRHQRSLRRKRTLLESQTECKLEKFTISVSDIGWDNWVTYPKVLDSSYCVGHCKTTSDDHSPTAINATQDKRMREALNCLPTKYDPLLLYHFDSEGKHVSTVFENLVVTECGCV